MIIPSFSIHRTVLFLCLVFILTLNSNKVSSLDLLGHECLNTTTYAPNSLYQSNLNNLFSVLSSNANAINGFYNFTAGRSPPNIAYGLFLCRGDVTTDFCQYCVATATKEIVQWCPNQRTAIIWYDRCMLRFSNQSMFSNVDHSVPLRKVHDQNVTDPTRLEELLRGVMNDVASRAPYSDSQSGKKFATSQANFSTSETLYCLAQCTPDITSSGCNTCLRDAMTLLDDCCGVRRGGTILFPSCNLKFELYPFYDINATATALLPSPVSPPPPLGPTSGTAQKEEKDHHNKRKLLLVILLPTISIVILILGFMLWYRRKRLFGFIGLTDDEKESQFKLGSTMACVGDNGDIGDTTAPNLHVFSLTDIVVATNNFSFENKLGEGGYGPVYKGKLQNGQEIAVKRLSKASKQGFEEFKNEVVLTAKLQHVNLVRVLGFCTEREEKMLIYEYMPNKSLDCYIYDPVRRLLLDWEKRVQIIEGVTQGLLYLQEYSRLTIIHRDLKANNILLDNEMKAKIADFGMAKIFQKDGLEANTGRIVGTYGYVPPEYVRRGIYSTKSDVYSFGVLLLQIISGKKNNCSYGLNESLNFLEYAYELWKDGKGMEFMDPSLDDAYSSCKFMRCMQIALLCVQESPADRPSMLEISSMLKSESTTINTPKRPAFSTKRDEDESTPRQEIFSVADTSITQIVAR